MKTASITETKNKLSALIHEVKRGETIVILDRGRPVAKLVSLVDEMGAAEESGKLLRLERAGAVRRAEEVPDISFVDSLPSLPPESESPLQALLEERETGR